MICDSFSRLHVEDPRALTPEDVVTVGSVAAALLNGALSVEELGDDTVLRALVTIGTLVRGVRRGYVPLLPTWLLSHLISSHFVSFLQALGAYPESKAVLAVHLNIFLGGKGASVTSAPVKECLEELQVVLSSGTESVDV